VGLYLKESIGDVTKFWYTNKKPFLYIIMSIKAGLVGLPNVGKSTLFNALTKSSVPAENYPFCTIDPHVAVTTVPDERLEALQKQYDSQRIIPSYMSFVDIAGLVKGAAEGEGLGNQFLTHIREVDLVIHVLRCFEDSKITNTQGQLDPLEDYTIITAELMLKDLEAVAKRLQKIEHQMKGARNKPAELKELITEKELLVEVEKALQQANQPKVYELVAASGMRTTELLSAKKSMIVANVGEDELADRAFEQNKHYQALVKQFGQKRVIAVSAKIEGELSRMSHEEAADMMSMLGITYRGLDLVIKAAYNNLGLISFFTCGPQEIHAWPIPKGIAIRQAAGEIHSDLERGFICADVVNYADLISSGSLASARSTGKIRTEGQGYLVQDGDIINVKFNV
jgi:GTP-binding protein YchF